MTRSLSVAAGLLVLALFVLLRGVELRPAADAGVAGPVHTGAPASGAAPAARDPVAAMLDDLAAWPIAAGQ